MSFFDKLNKMKQFAKEKVGKAETTADSQEYVDAVAQFKATKHELTGFLESAKKWHKAQTSALDSFMGLGVSTATVQSTDVTAHNSLRAFGTFIAEAHTAQASALSAFKAQVVDGINDLIEGDIKACDKLIKKASDARLDFDAKQASFKSAVESKKASQADIDAAQAKADEAESQHNSLKREVLVSCKTIEDKKKAIVTAQLGEYAKATVTGANEEIGAANKFISSTQ